LEVKILAVAFDGINLRSVEVVKFSHIGNESTAVAYWNFSTTDLLDIASTLDPEATDEAYYQIVISGYDTTKLTTGDTIDFQIALAENTNPFAWSHIKMAQGFAVIGGLFFFVMAMASTPYWNPLEGNGTVNRGYRKAKSYVKRRTRAKRSRSRRRK